ncbi:Maf family protein [Kiritimatiellaeota bacterium B1221]|nr:Maf family protein [Kiritimatiellaeota bacterium B1221]
MKLILASASPRRAELLRSAGIRFEALAAEVDETPLPREEPEALVCRLSRSKAEAVAALHPDAAVLAADTVVVFDEEIFGKPGTAEEAVDMLEQLSGDQHEVMTGFTLLRPGSDAICELVVTEVTFRELGKAEIQSYVDSGEPMDKAGAYGIQAGAAGFVSRIEGSYTNVVGLPLAEVVGLISGT